MAIITPERDLEESLVTKLQDLKYEYRDDIRDRATLEANFRKKFEALNRVKFTDGEFQRLLDEIVTADVYEAARSLRNREAFIRDDGTPLNYTLVNIKDWCKNHFEVVNQLRVNTDNSYHRYDVILLINGVPVVQIELKTLGISPRRAMEQIVDYKNDPVTATPRRSCASSSSSSSATARTRGTSPTTTRGTSPSTRTSGSFRSTSLRPRTTPRSPTSTTSPIGSSPSARLAR